MESEPREGPGSGWIAESETRLEDIVAVAHSEEDQLVIQLDYYGRKANGAALALFGSVVSLCSLYLVYRDTDWVPAMVFCLAMTAWGFRMAWNTPAAYAIFDRGSGKVRFKRGDRTEAVPISALRFEILEMRRYKGSGRHYAILILGEMLGRKRLDISGTRKAGPEVMLAIARFLQEYVRNDALGPRGIPSPVKPWVPMSGRQVVQSLLIALAIIAIVFGTVALLAWS